MMLDMEEYCELLYKVFLYFGENCCIEILFLGVCIVNVKFGCNVIVMLGCLMILVGGIIIGENVVVGVGSVVMYDVELNIFVVGNFVKFICKIKL